MVPTLSCLQTDGSLQVLACPFKCGVPAHILAVGWGACVPASKSGPGLVVECYCENLHHWNLLATDHSGSIFLATKLLPDLQYDPVLAQKLKG